MQSFNLKGRKVQPTPTKKAEAMSEEQVQPTTAAPENLSCLWNVWVLKQFLPNAPSDSPFISRLLPNGGPILIKGVPGYDAAFFFSTFEWKRLSRVQPEVAKTNLKRERLVTRSRKHTMRSSCTRRLV